MDYNRAPQKILLTLSAFIGVTLASFGCTTPFSEEARFGVVFYCPGAGNWDIGARGVKDGLKEAGFNGQVATVLWSVLANPAIDQTLRLNAVAAGKRVGDRIEEFIDKYPDKPVSIVGLSAGSGVAMWALESLKPGYKVDNVVLLSSSLSYDYDPTKALKAVKGKIYVYYSPYDAVLAGPMRIFGTIDGKYGEVGAGEVGLKPARGSERIVNIEYDPGFRKYGYLGGHMDSTAPQFVRAVLAKHLLNGDERRPETRVASQRDRVAQGATH
ncbi:MAG: hypothetical protein AB7N71_05110 [Phycisphaerae bacterium]